MVSEIKFCVRLLEIRITYTLLISFLSDRVKAIKDMWLVGDVMLKELFHTLHTLKAPANRPSSEYDIYIHQKYNMRQVYSDDFRKENTMLHMLNSLIRELNENQKLPRFIVFLIDHEFIKMMNHIGFGISLMMGKCLHWFLNQVEIAISRKKELLAFKKAGATQTLEPKLIWVKMIEQVQDKNMAMAKIKFNVILEQALAQMKSGFILAVIPDGDRRFL